MQQQTAVIIGASGLIGSNLLQQLLKDNDFSNVTILVRNKLPFEHLKLRQVIINFNHEDEYRQMGIGDIIFCCIGTTQKKVKGNKKEYEKIDVEIPVTAAETGSKQGFKKFLIVSSVGADVNSSNFYLHIKGKMENAIRQTLFSSISIFRPSMLLGQRSESRPLERVGQTIMKSFSFIFINKIKKYHPIQADQVAGAMIVVSKENTTGITVFEYNEMMSLINKDQHQQ